MTVEKSSAYACTLHWPAGPAGASRGQLWLRNDVGQLQVPNTSDGPPAEIQIDFTKAGVDLDLDASTITCRGFTVTSASAGVVVLQQSYARLTWSEDTPWIVSFAKLPRPTDSTGTVSVTLTNVFPLEDPQTATTQFVTESVDLDTWVAQHPVNARDDATSVQITSFTVSPTALQNIIEPTIVHLSWNTTAANNKVTLTGFGVVSNSGVLSTAILETTSFVLTVYDANLIPVASQSVEVTVTPSIRSRLVPDSSVLAYRGSAAPTGWAMCDGQTSGVPDMRDKFILGAGSLNVDHTESNEIHSHGIAAKNSSAFGPWVTSTNGSHSHTMPSTWTAAKWDDGKDTWSINCGSSYSASSTSTQQDGNHSHTAPFSYGGSGVLTGDSIGGQRPPWYALAYMMKLPQILSGAASTTPQTTGQLIVNFGATATSPTDNNGSVQVSLNWQTTNATSVIIAPLGRMTATNGTTQCSISQTTTFTLIAFQGANIASRSIVVTVTPDLRTHLVPSNIIVPMNLTVAPYGWVQCNGTQGTPNLGGRFVVCLGTEHLDAFGDADTHTHQEKVAHHSTSTNDGPAHTHKLPTGWTGHVMDNDSKNCVGINTNNNSYDSNTTTRSASSSAHHFSYTITYTTTNAASTCPLWYTLYYYMKVDT